MFCGEQSIQASSHFGQVAAPVKCKRWGCPNCTEWRQNCLMARCIEGKPDRFLTVTCRRGQYPTEAETAKAISRAWATVVLRWRRLRKNHKCEYICVFEPHVSGWPHLHILWKGPWIDQGWLSQQFMELLNSPVVHVSRIRDNKSAAFYVGKYFSKEPQKFGTSKRYWTSKGWPKLVHIDAQRAFHNGFPVELINKQIHEIVATWKRYHKPVWQRPPDVVGWGLLYSPFPENQQPKKPPWNAVFGFQVASTRRNPAPMARGRGVLG